MKEFKIYLAGKMTGLSFENSDMWRRNLKCRIYEQAFYSEIRPIVINPNDFYNFKEPSHKSEREIMQYDLNHVRNSDIIVVNLDGINTSIGTAMELYAAAQLNIPVIAFGRNGEWSETHPWLKECISRAETGENSIDRLLIYLRDYYFNVE